MRFDNIVCFWCLSHLVVKVVFVILDALTLSAQNIKLPQQDNLHNLFDQIQHEFENLSTENTKCALNPFFMFSRVQIVNVVDLVKLSRMLSPTNTVHSTTGDCLSQQADTRRWADQRGGRPHQGRPQDKG